MAAARANSFAFDAKTVPGSEKTARCGPAQVLVAFEARNPSELTITRDEFVEILGFSQEEDPLYSYIQNSDGKRGFVPKTMLSKPSGSSAPTLCTTSKANPLMEVTIDSEKCQSDQTGLKSSMTKNTSNVKKSKLGFTLFSHNLAYASSFFLIVLGPVQIGWEAAANDVDKFQRPDAISLLLPFDGLPISWLGFYCIALGLLCFAFEFFWGLRRRRWRRFWWFPTRGFCYLLVAVPCFLGYPTMLAGVSLGMTAVANFLATYSQEFGDARNASYLLKYDRTIRKKRPSSETTSKDDARNTSRITRIFQTLRNGAQSWVDRQREQGELGKICILAVYFAINIVLFGESYARWSNIVANGQDEEKWLRDPPEQPCLGPFDPFTGKDIAACLSSSAPIAKAFGQLLNFNCSLLLFPVLRLLLRKLNNIRFGYGLTQSVAKYVPLRKNIVFHKLIALVILGATFFHIIFHLVNFSRRPEATRKMFGLGPWLTGSIILLAMVIIYAGAQSRVKEAHYEIFWFSHHFFVVFFVVMLAHGPVFWCWSLLPLGLYVCERLLRIFRKTKPFLVASVQYSEPILCISIFPKQDGGFSFREGQYVYLNCPHVSSQEWHPFTISSPADDLGGEKSTGSPVSMTLHIRVVPSQWTGDVMEYFAAMAATQNRGSEGAISSFSLELNHIDGTGKHTRGKYLGPDGRPLLCIDGPHAAPCQHYSEYGELMLIGSGIGLTPSSAIVQAILRHKWRRGYSPEVLHFFWIVRHSEIRSFRWFIEILSKLESDIVRDTTAGTLNNTRRHEIQIYITRAPKDEELSHSIPSVPSHFEVWQGKSFSAEDLQAAMLKPSLLSKDQFGKKDPMLTGGASKKHVVQIWNGRPDWSAVFTNIKAKRAPFVKDIGVCFCGAPAIGKDLKAQCRLKSSVQEGMIFSLHKENF